MKPNVTTTLYEFNLSCQHTAPVLVDARTMEPLDPKTLKPSGGVYTCPECGTQERAY